jgi:PhzF family phenazine biosynthesis protein
MPPFDLYQVDAFADRAFAGNPAAVCFLDGPRDERWMQSVAREVSLPATAFLEEGEDGFRLRWFTPAAELDLCGHGSLASSHALWESGRLGAAETARFHTRSGLLTAERVEGWIWLDFPARRVEPAEPPAGLLAALGAEPVAVGASGSSFLVEVASEEEVRALAPDFPALRLLPVQRIIVTARGTASPYDFVSRYFAPGVGLDEDPVTGSAHCALAPYWISRLGKDELLAYQASTRGGAVRVKMAGERVRLGGQAVTILQGRWLAD